MVTAGVSRLFVDTNISVFATDAGSPFQSAAETDTPSPVNSATTSAGRRASLEIGLREWQDHDFAG